MAEGEFDRAKDYTTRFIQTSPDIKLENPPAALFASGSENHVDLFGALSVVALKKPTELVVFDPIEERESQGVFDADENVDAQIEDIRFVRGKMDNEDPEVFKRRVLEIFDFIERKKLFLHGTLELEANAFESSLFVDVDPKIIEKLESVHRHFRDGRTFPKIERTGLRKKKIVIRFIGRAIGQLWPRAKGITGKDFMVNLNEIRGYASGIVVVAGDDAEFIILTDSIISNEQKFDWIVMKQLLEDLKQKRKVPVCWFRWDFGLNALKKIWGFESIKDDKDIKKAIKRYNERIANIVIDFYKDASITEDGKRVELEKLPEVEKKAAIEDLLETMTILDQMLMETEKGKDNAE